MTALGFAPGTTRSWTGWELSWPVNLPQLAGAIRAGGVALPAIMGLALSGETPFASILVGDCRSYLRYRRGHR